MNYCFMSANEDLDSGLLQSQFCEPIINQFTEESTIYSFNRPFFKNFNNPKIEQINILIPPRLIAYNVWCLLYVPWAIFIAVLCRYKLSNQSNRTIFVARGYLPGLICYFLNRIFRFTYIFDPRSLYPLECQTAGRMNRNSFCFKFWMLVERWVIDSAEFTSCVSEGMMRYFRRRYRSENLLLIPCFSSNSVTKKQSPTKADVYRNLGLSANKCLVIYYGSLNFGWNNIEVYRRAILAFNPDLYQFLIITQDQKLVASTSLGTVSNVFIHSVQTLPSGLSVTNCFNSADFGLLLMSRSHDWFTRLSVKFAEYTAHGLPVLTNKWVGEAASLITRHRLPGCHIIDPEKPGNLAIATMDQRYSLAEWAKEYFSSKKINYIKQGIS